MSRAAIDLATIELDHVLELPDGRLVEWEALGSGPEPLVWVEGGPGLPAHLARADVAHVLDRFRCHLVNAPGSGRTSPPLDDAGYDLAAIAGFFEATRRALRLGPVTVMGHSWGGLVGAAWAALHPAGVRRLIVIAGYGGGGSVDAGAAEAERDRALDRLRDLPWFEGAWTALQEVDGLTDEAEVAAAFAAYFPFYFAHPEDPVSTGHIERIRREQRWRLPAVRAWSGPREEADYRALVGGTRCPTLVISGEHDWICGPTWGRALADAIPGARFEVISDVGHLPQYEAPGRFRAVIDEWLASGA